VTVLTLPLVNDRATAGAPLTDLLRKGSP
jgi:hypothetical protein